MSSYSRMERAFLRGVLWLYLLGFGYMALSLEPGFLDFDNLPDTNFTCVGKVIGGYYADLETNCQMFHVCTIGQMDEPMDIRFLCLNGTVFDQETRVCERIDEVDCSKSEQFYSLNLELYGNSQPSILEENPETEQPLIIKSTTTVKPTTTPPAPLTTPSSYYTSSASPSAGTPPSGSGDPKTVSSHHFPLINRNSPDIRFNPEEINISLHPGAPPDIRTNSAYQQRQQHDYGDKTTSGGGTGAKVSSTTHRVVHSSTPSTTQVRYNNGPTAGDINLEYNYGQDDEDDSDEEDSRQGDFHFHRQEYQPEPKYSDNSHHFKSSTYRNDYAHSTPRINNYQHQQQHHHHNPTTVKNIYIQSLKPPALNERSHYGEFRTEKPPQRLQLPLPLLPTLPTLTFSTPAPFALHPHIETKRYTKEHYSPPRIIISASASVSDDSGRRLNYSLGTIGAAQILQQAPTSYDEYREEDVGLDPFYHDVPKVKGSKRRKRSLEESNSKPSVIIENEQQAVEVLKFLFDWYRSEKTNPSKTTTPYNLPLSTIGITEINDELAPLNGAVEDQEENQKEFRVNYTKLFDPKSKYSIVGVGNTKDKIIIDTNTDGQLAGTSPDQVFQHEHDYVDDNYEPENFKQTNQSEIGQKEYETTQKYGVMTHDEKVKNHSLPVDYVDDNIEPLYYSERHKSEELTTAATVENSKVYISEETSNGENERMNSQHAEKNDGINQYLNTHTLNETNNRFILQEEQNSVQNNQSTTENIKVNRESPANEISKRSRNNRRRGRRKHQDKETNKETIDFKNILIEKLIERPYRAKDDYDYLKTVSNVVASTIKNLNIDPEGSESGKSFSTRKDYLDDTTNESDIDTYLNIDSPTSTEPLTIPTLYTITSTTTRKPNSGNSRRRGRHRFHAAESDRSQSKKRIKNQSTTTTTTTTELAIADNNLASIFTDNVQTTSQMGHYYTDHSENVSINVPTIDTTTQTTPSTVYEDLNIGTSRLPPTEPTLSILEKKITTQEDTIISTTESNIKVDQSSELVYKLHNEHFSTTENLYEYLRKNNITVIDLDILKDADGTREDLEDIIAEDTITKDVSATTYTILMKDSETTTEHSSVPEGYKHNLGNEHGKNNNVLEEKEIFKDYTHLKTILDEYENIPTESTTVGIAIENSDITTSSSNEADNLGIEDIGEKPYDTTTHHGDGTTNNSYNEILDRNETEISHTLPIETTTDYESYLQKSNKPLENFAQAYPVKTTLLETTTIAISTLENVQDLSEYNAKPESATELCIEVPLSEEHDEITQQLDGVNHSPPNHPPLIHDIFDAKEVLPKENNGTNNSSRIYEGAKQKHYETIEIESQTTDVSSELEDLIRTKSETTTIGNVEKIHDTSNQTSNYNQHEEPEKASNHSQHAKALLGEISKSNKDTTTSEADVTTITESTTPEVQTVESSSDHKNILTSISTPASISSTIKSRRRGTRPSRTKPSTNQHRYRHRFSTQQFTTKTSPTVTDFIESIRRKTNPSTEQHLEELSTEAPLKKNAIPTKSERQRDESLPTTPLSRMTVRKHYFFNCFGRKLDKFYPDARDCRLFHYCTQGYTKNQLLDLKFVCDLNTFFDDEKLICTKIKPARCL